MTEPLTPVERDLLHLKSVYERKASDPRFQVQAQAGLERTKAAIVARKPSRAGVLA